MQSPPLCANILILVVSLLFSSCDTFSGFSIQLILCWLWCYVVLFQICNPSAIFNCIHYDCWLFVAIFVEGHRHLLFHNCLDVVIFYYCSYLDFSLLSKFCDLLPLLLGFCRAFVDGFFKRYLFLLELIEWEFYQAIVTISRGVRHVHKSFNLFEIKFCLNVLFFLLYSVNSLIKWQT